MLFGKKEFFTVPAYPVNKVKDPTGAGDCFAGGFAGFLAQLDKINFQNLSWRLYTEQLMASFCVEGFGTSVMENLRKKKDN